MFKVNDSFLLFNLFFFFLFFFISFISFSYFSHFFFLFQINKYSRLRHLGSLNKSFIGKASFCNHYLECYKLVILTKEFSQKSQISLLHKLASELVRYSYSMEHLFTFENPSTLIQLSYLQFRLFGHVTWLLINLTNNLNPEDFELSCSQLQNRVQIILRSFFLKKNISFSFDCNRQISFLSFSFFFILVIINKFQSIIRHWN